MLIKEPYSAKISAYGTVNNHAILFSGKRFDKIKDIFTRKNKPSKTARTSPINKIKDNKDKPPMITLDFNNISQSKVTQSHGLDTQAVFNQYRDEIKTIVTRLYQTKDDVGGWKKWLNLGTNTTLATDINNYVKRVEGKYGDVVVLGIGGSSLGGYALLRALKHPYWNNLTTEQRNNQPRYHFIENVDADQVNGLFDVLNPEKTLFCVISKSGTTAETMSAFMIAKNWLNKNLPDAPLKDHVVAITDNEKGVLRPLADKEGLQTFEVPDDVGGRFSVFSAVGLLPAALCGVDINAMQQGIQDLDAQLQNPDIDKNPAAQGALISHVLNTQKNKSSQVFMPYSNRLASVSDWFVQLWAESLGKKFSTDGKEVFAGQTPIRAVGVTDQHSQVQLFNEGPHDKMITFVNVEKPEKSAMIPDEFSDIEALAYLRNQPLEKLMNAEFQGTRDALTENNRPNMTITLPKVDAYYLAQLLYLLQVQTAIAGDLMGIDPFDQPGVERAKVLTKEYMSKTPVKA